MNLLDKLKVCFHVFIGSQVLYNISIYGKVRIKFKKGIRVCAQNLIFYSDIVTDKVIILPDDIPKNLIRDENYFDSTEILRNKKGRR